MAVNEKTSSWHYLFLFTLLLPINAQPKRSINIALHAQVAPGHGPIVGSVMTTEGLKYALLENPKLWGEDIEVGHVEVFYPFSYGSSLFTNTWDVVIIEGWFLSINSFIHEVRRTGRANSDLLSPFGPIILFWCLDPIFPGLDIISALDLDGVMSNSHRAISEFKQMNPYLPTSYVMLAARQPEEVHSQNSNSGNGQDHKDEELVNKAVEMSRGKLVYVGSMGGLESKLLLGPLLREAIKANLPSRNNCPNSSPECASSSSLVVFGAGWDNSEFRDVWGGRLPHAPGALARVYEVAFAVIGATMDDQREYGMVNNRVFEVLASGALFISEHFTELEDLLGPWSPTLGGASCYVRNNQIEMLHTCVAEALEVNSRNQTSFEAVMMLEAQDSDQDKVRVISTDDTRRTNHEHVDPMTNQFNIWKFLLQRCHGDARCARKKLIGSAHTYKHRLRTIVNTTLNIVENRELANMKLKLDKEARSGDFIPFDLSQDPLTWLDSLKRGLKRGNYDATFGFHPFRPNYQASGDIGGAPLSMVDSLNRLTNHCLRPKCPRVALLFDPTDKYFSSIEFATTFLSSITSIGSMYSLHWLDVGSIARKWQPPMPDSSTDHGDNKFDLKHKGHWHLDTTWANSYDIIWTLGCPGDMADLATRALPPAITMGGAPRLRSLLLLSSECMMNLDADFHKIGIKYEKQVKALKQMENKVFTQLNSAKIDHKFLFDLKSGNINLPLEEDEKEGDDTMVLKTGHHRKSGAAGFRDRLAKQWQEAKMLRESLELPVAVDYRERLAHTIDQLRVYDLVYLNHHIDQSALANHFQIPSFQYVHGINSKAFMHSSRSKEEDTHTSVLPSAIVVFLGEILQPFQLRRKQISHTLTHAFRCLTNHTKIKDQAETEMNADEMAGSSHSDDVGSCLSSTFDVGLRKTSTSVQLLITGVAMDLSLIDAVSELVSESWRNMMMDMQEELGFEPNWHQSIHEQLSENQFLTHVLPEKPSLDIPCMYIETTSSSHRNHMNYCPITVKFLSVEQSRSGALFSLIQHSRCIFLPIKYEEAEIMLDYNLPNKTYLNDSLHQSAPRILEPSSGVTYEDDWLLDIVTCAKSQPHTQRVFAVDSLIQRTMTVPSIEQYATSLIMGVTRGYTLARTNSAVSFSMKLYEHNSPVKIFHSGHNRFSVEDFLHSPLTASLSLERQDRLWLASEAYKIEVDFYLEDFDIGRDGSACLFANDRMLSCILQPQLQLDLRVLRDDFLVKQAEEEAQHSSSSSSATEAAAAAGAKEMDFDIVFHVELKSPIYADVLRKSKPITLRLSSLTKTVIKSPLFDKEEGREKEEANTIGVKRRSMPWDFQLSTFGQNKALVYVNDIASNQPLNIVLNQDRVIPFKFTKHDNLQELAYQFVKHHSMDQTMGMGCEVGDVECLSQTLTAVMQAMIHEEEIRHSEFVEQEEKKRQEALIQEEEVKQKEREKLFVLQQRIKTMKEEQKNPNVILRQEDQMVKEEDFVKVEEKNEQNLIEIGKNSAETSKDVKVKEMEKAMALKLKQKLGRAIAGASSRRIDGSGESLQNKKEIVVGEDGHWEFK